MKFAIEKFWFDQHRDEVESCVCGGGVAVVFSRKSPDRSGANQDAAGLFQFDENNLVMAVADGMGGASCGDRAAQAVITAIGQKVAQLDTPENLRAALVDAIEETNEFILGWGLGAGATVAVATIRNDIARVLHIGDAEGLICSNRGRVKWSTVSHAPVAMAVEIGVMDEFTAMNHDDRNLVNNFVGSKEMRIEIGPSIKLNLNDTLLLATDGLFDNLMSQEIVELIRRNPVDKQAVRLMKAAGQRMRGDDQSQPNKPDDITVMMYRGNRKLRNQQAPSVVESNC